MKFVSEIASLDRAIKKSFVSASSRFQNKPMRSSFAACVYYAVGRAGGSCRDGDNPPSLRALFASQEPDPGSLTEVHMLLM